MAKISQLPRMPQHEGTGAELVPIVKGGQTMGAAITDVVAPAALPFVEAAAAHEAQAQLAATSAAIDGKLFDTIEAGLLTAPEGGDFRVRGAGDLYAADYRKVNGAAVKLPGELPSKAYMDGIAPAVGGKVLALRKATGVDVSNPFKDNGTAMLAALSEAMLWGKTVDAENDLFRAGPEWAAALPVTGRLKLRGDGGRIVATSGTRTKQFAALRAPVEIEGVDFENFASLFACDTNGLDLSDHDLIFRNINHTAAGGALIFTTLEHFLIRDLIAENIWIDGPAAASGAGFGQGIRYQSNGFRRAYLRNIVARNREFQGVRIGGYPHGKILNRNIHMESIHIDGVIGSGQNNGVQAFGSDIFMDDIFVRRVDCYTGASSNVEAVYTVGEYVTLGNITIEQAGNQQGALAIKSSKTRQHGPIRIRTNLHPRMNAAVRVDGSDLELTGGLDIEWLWEPVAAASAYGADGYAVTYTHLDTALTDQLDYFFVPHAVNTTASPEISIGGFGPLPMVAVEQGAMFPGQIRPGAVYRARRKPSTNNVEVSAVNWNANVAVVSGANSTAELPGPLVDGGVYWITSLRSTGNATISIGGSAPIPVMARTADGLVPKGLPAGYPRGFYYSAADNALIELARSGSPNSDDAIGRFVPEVTGEANAYTFRHPYPADYANALFVLFPVANTGSATLNGDPILRSTGTALTSGYLSPRILFQLIRSGSNWVATQVANSFPAIDVFSGAGGRQIIRDVTISNGQYHGVVTCTSAGLAVVDGVKTLGRSRITSNAVSFNLSISAPVKAHAYARNINLSYFYGDNPDTVVRIGTGFDLLDVYNVPAPRVRGTLGTTRGAVIGSTTVAGTVGRLKLREVYRGENQQSLIPYPSAFTVIDSDHVTATGSVNPPAISAGGYVEFSSNYTHLGVEPGDAITVTHEMNGSRIQFGGYATARDVVKVFMRDPNPAGAAVDLDAGRLFITSRRLRP